MCMPMRTGSSPGRESHRGALGPSSMANGIVSEHARAFGRNQTVHDPWHHVPVLARKPGALRNGATFKDWVPPPAMAAIRRKLKGNDDGDRQMVQILTCVRDDGLMTVEAASECRSSDLR